MVVDANEDISIVYRPTIRTGAAAHVVLFWRRGGGRFFCGGGGSCRYTISGTVTEASACGNIERMLFIFVW